jgi:hypothetical protein
MGVAAGEAGMKRNVGAKGSERRRKRGRGAPGLGWEGAGTKAEERQPAAVVAQMQSLRAVVVQGPGAAEQTDLGLRHANGVSHLSLPAAGLNVEKSSLLTLIPYIAMTVMTPLVGPVADGLVQRGWSVTSVRKLSQVRTRGPAPLCTICMSFRCLLCAGSCKPPCLPCAVLSCLRCLNPGIWRLENDALCVAAAYLTTPCLAIRVSSDPAGRRASPLRGRRCACWPWQC